MAAQDLIGALGPKLRQARREAGFKNTESLAVALGVGQRTVQRWETGRADPSIRQVIEIARVTGKPLSWFLDGGVDAGAEGMKAA